MVTTYPSRLRRSHLMAVPVALLSSALALSGCGKLQPEKTATSQQASEIAWRQGDVADAFAEAVEQKKPVLLYWGAVWCPPCNRLKAGLFKDPEFVARTRDFIPVYLDGDSKGAQAWGERFAIKGYPTLIVLRPDQSEITRLSGGGEPDQVAAVLAAVQKGTGSFAELVQRVRTDPGSLSDADWTLLAGYGGWIDEEGSGGPAAVLPKLAAAAPTPDLRRQFALQALARRSPKDPPPAPAVQAEARTVLEAVLANPAELRANRATLAQNAVPLVQAAAPAGPAREALARRLTTALESFQGDEGLTALDRLSAVGAEIALFQAAAGKDAPLPAELVRKVHERVVWADKAARNPHERQSLISTAARLLSQAGDSKGAEALLKAELGKSAAPYYYMPTLAKLAEERGDKATAVDWLRRGYETSEGPASRVQWGVTYVEGLLRLTPEDDAVIEKATGQVIGELASQPDGYRQRTRQRLEGLGKSLQEWSNTHNGAGTLQRLRARTAEACAAQADNKVLDACRNWLNAA